MSIESSAIDPYEAVLADLRAKRDKISNTIAVLESLRGPLGADVLSMAAPVASPGPGEGGIEETAGMYLGMSIVDATKKLLGLRKRTMGNVEIARELKAGGLILTGADPVNVIGSVLTRRFNQIGDVVKVGRGIWGLKEWYPGRNFKPISKTSSEAAPADAEVQDEPSEMGAFAESNAVGGFDGPKQF